ncbi:MAG TPA: M14 family metallopeptidase [Bacteroidales bacterium]|nr:M14 family metallopeptidase [Bacteroidales bacterium]
MKKIVFLLLFVIYNVLSFAQSAQWLTWYEKSNFLETPRYEETIKYSKMLANASDFIHYTTFGISPQGRDLPILIADKNQNFTPESVHESGNAVLLIEACIHPGESEGKDAGLLFLRDVFIHQKYPDLLENTTILFIPIFNVDGHERFSPYNRINQNGPKEMGWRTTATNYNLNRDFTKADAPEMQQWLQLFNAWMPDMFMDIHTTDGADYEYQLTYAMPVQGEMNQIQTDWQNQYIEDIEQKLLKEDVLIFPYVSFRRWHDPKSGLIRRPQSPRYSIGYSAIQNRPALLVETHMLKDYKTRVDATYHLLVHTSEILDTEYKHLKRINADADNQAKNLAGKELFLDFTISPKDSTTIKFKGVDYTIVKSDLTGGDWVQFTEKPKEYELVLFEEVVPSKKVILPEAYIVPVEWTKVINRVKWHGINFKTLKKDTTISIETYKFSEVQFANFPYEGRQMVRNFNQEPIQIEKKFHKGSVIIPVNQRSAKLIAHLLEPKSPDSFLSWGFFNTIFERKEYVETYVMEEMAREMIEGNPELKIEFEKAVTENPELYNNQWSKVFWFFERTPYWDNQKDIYPVGRLDEAF